MTLAVATRVPWARVLIVRQLARHPAKRTYELTVEGMRLLDEWAGALQVSRERIDTFLDRYEGR